MIMEHSPCPLYQKKLPPEGVPVPGSQHRNRFPTRFAFCNRALALLGSALGEPGNRDGVWVSGQSHPMVTSGLGVL